MTFTLTLIDNMYANMSFISNLNLCHMLVVNQWSQGREVLSVLSLISEKLSGLNNITPK